MKKALFLAGLLLTLVFSQAFATPAPVASPVNPKNLIESSVNRLYHPRLVPVAKMANGMLKATVTRGTEKLIDVYVWLGYINEYSSWPGYYADVQMRFYEDLNATIPYSTSGLEVNYQITGFNGWNSYSEPMTLYAYGTDLMVAYNQELDYDDGTVFRWRGYSLRPGGYIPLS
ncbi:hypothetical protein [Chitinophaga barathri]|uniref:Uncharacterized protein n=1 Tax=Chitinophaga barathri TaxID=1647451 RepID=A0A3N4MF51_9BACT|nr:hypothetical protein [Chitinophaga barathri]RPD42015.1 hypothetical protein EG028_07635 [Chitinophaga barathri]